jgi:hypothetical protein
MNAVDVVCKSPVMFPSVQAMMVGPFEILVLLAVAAIVAGIVALIVFLVNRPPDRGDRP